MFADSGVSLAVCLEIWTIALKKKHQFSIQGRTPRTYSFPGDQRTDYTNMGSTEEEFFFLRGYHEQKVDMEPDRTSTTFSLLTSSLQPVNAMCKTYNTTVVHDELGCYAEPT